MGVCGLILGGRTLTLRFLRNEKGLLLQTGQKWDPTMWSSDLGHDEMGSLT
jgi:hypothetical protein